MVEKMFKNSYLIHCKTHVNLKWYALKVFHPIYCTVYFIDLDEPLVNINGENNRDSHIAKQIHEGVQLQLACSVNGNPDPKIRLSKEMHDSVSLQMEEEKWLNHTIEYTQCSHTGTYKCTGVSRGFTNTEKTFGINVTCEFFIRVNYILVFEC